MKTKGVQPPQAPQACRRSLPPQLVTSSLHVYFVLLPRWVAWLPGRRWVVWLRCRQWVMWLPRRLWVVWLPCRRWAVWLPRRRWVVWLRSIGGYMEARLSGKDRLQLQELVPTLSKPPMCQSMYFWQAFIDVPPRGVYYKNLSSLTFSDQSKKAFKF